MPVTHPLMKPPSNAFAPYKAYTDLKYASPAQCKVNLYVPDNGWSKVPCVLYGHGGGWSGGSRTDNLLLFMPLIRRGLAVASFDYRLSSVAKFPAQVVDFNQCARWILANAATYRIWTGGIFNMGGSAGGHLAAMTGLAPQTARFTGGVTGVPRPLMVVADYPPTDLAAWLAGPSDINHAQMADGLLGTPRTAQKLAEASPVSWTNETGISPFYIRHGSADTSVPPSQSQDLHDLIQLAGGRSELEIIDGLKHADMGFYTEARMNGIADRLATRLGEVVPA